MCQGGELENFQKLLEKEDGEIKSSTIQCVYSDRFLILLYDKEDKKTMTWEGHSKTHMGGLPIIDGLVIEF